MRSGGSSLCRTCYDTGPHLLGPHRLLASYDKPGKPRTYSNFINKRVFTSILWLWQHSLIPKFSFQLILNIKWSFQAKGYSRVKEKAYPSVKEKSLSTIPTIGRGRETSKNKFCLHILDQRSWICHWSQNSNEIYMCT